MAEDPLKAVLHYARVLKAPRIRDSAARLADQARDGGWSHEEYLAAVLSREVAAREASGAAIRIRSAGFPTRKSLEDFNFDHQPALNRDTIAHLGTSAFLAKASNVVLLGPPGQEGTSGDRTGDQGRSSRPPRRVRHRRGLGCPPQNRPPRRTVARRAGQAAPHRTTRRRRGRLHPLRKDAANLFFQLASSRYEHASLILTSNLPFARWGDVFGDQVVAAAMIDRIVHHAEVLTLKGSSYRLKDTGIDTLPSARADNTAQ